MTRWLLPVLLVAAGIVGPGHVSRASAQNVRVDVLLPYGRVQLGGPTVLFPRSAVRPGRAQVLVVHVPVLFAYRSQACAEVQIMTHLARMVPAEEGFGGQLALGASFVCSALDASFDRWPNGERATTLGGDWFYPNGERATATTGSWYYPDGSRARSVTATWYYPDGSRARSSGGTWFTPAGDRVGKLHAHVGQEVTVAILERLWKTTPGH